MSPLIYGLGTGHFNRLSSQVPTTMRAALRTGRADVIGDGMGEWDHVHIDDLVVLYELMVAKIVAGVEIPSGFYFSANGRCRWRDVAGGVAGALQAAGIGEGGVGSVSLEEGAERWTGGDVLQAELVYASKYVLPPFTVRIDGKEYTDKLVGCSARTQSDRSRSLGWDPKRGERDFREHFSIELEAIREEQRLGGGKLQRDKHLNFAGG
jgi:nucleoside-diphosphate-sugar epimerase